MPALIGADLSESMLGESELSEADLRGANLKSAELIGNVSAECWAQLGRKTPPLRYEIRKSWRVRPTDSTGLLVGAVGIEPTTFGLKGRCSTTELRPYDMTFLL